MTTKKESEKKITPQGDVYCKSDRTCCGNNPGCSASYQDVFGVPTFQTCGC